VTQACPRCGAPREPSYKYCPVCQLDFRAADRRAHAAADIPENVSFTERYRGTAWESKATLPPIPQPSARPIVLNVLVGFAVLSAVVVAIIYFKQARYFNFRVGLEWFALVPLVIPLLAGIVSKVVPGRKARGVFKGWLLGYAGWWVGVTVVFVLGSFTAPVIPANMGWIIDQALLALGGTIALRAGLMFFD
jgi:hypothetical protein